MQSPRQLSELRDRVRCLGIPMIGQSLAFERLLCAVERVARHAGSTVLIYGETGTGKELVARAIHYLGPRREYAFVPINCGALPEALVENELFGHRQGAFTGALRESAGLLQLAHKGTLFLDEVDSLPLKAQVALLRFLEDGNFRPLGAAKEVRADVRVLAASNRRLEDAVREGGFRQDLFYRLNLISLEVPALRERSGDVLVLSQFFLQRWSRENNLPDRRLHPATSNWFADYAWPGNVRELENVIRRECLLSDDAVLIIDAPRSASAPPTRALQSMPDLATATYRAAKSRAIEHFDRTYLRDLIKRTKGNVTQAALLAGKERRALGKLLKRYRIDYVDAAAEPECRD